MERHSRRVSWSTVSPFSAIHDSMVVLYFSFVEIKPTYSHTYNEFNKPRVDSWGHKLYGQVRWYCLEVVELYRLHGLHM